MRVALPHLTQTALTIRSDGIARLALARPKANAMSIVMMEEITTAIRHVQHDDAVKGLVIASDVPRIFCAGLDLTEVCDMVACKDIARLSRCYTAMDECFRAAPLCPKPVVAAIDGHAVAGALFGVGCAGGNRCVAPYHALYR